MLAGWKVSSWVKDVCEAQGLNISIQEQDGFKFEAYLGYIARLLLKNTKFLSQKGGKRKQSSLELQNCTKNNENYQGNSI